jgi:glycosyltransferase involved in cell wall biosynthesis
MNERRLRVVAVATHPVQYMAPIFRRLAAHEGVDLHVVYGSLRGAQAAVDPDFGTTVQWDVPLLDGYSWTHLTSGTSTLMLSRVGHPTLWKFIREGEFDAVLCYTGYLHPAFWIALAAAKVSGAAFLFGTDSASLAPRDGKPWKKTFKQIVWPSLFGLADQVIVPSTNTRELMISLGLPEARVTLTPYTVDNDWWTARAAQVDREAVRKSWGAGPETLVVLFCAKLQPWKRPRDLLRAFAKAAIQDSILVIAGDGPLRAALAAEASALGIKDRVRFLGFLNQSQLPPVYVGADLMVLPSRYEPFAVVVNEAMCCGCPVAASDRVGAARDLVAPVKPEFIYRCGNLEALAGILRWAAENREELRGLRQAVAARMRDWSPEQNIAATVAAVRIAVSRIAGEEPDAEEPSGLGATTNPAAHASSGKLHAGKFRE